MRLLLALLLALPVVSLGAPLGWPGMAVSSASADPQPPAESRPPADARAGREQEARVQFARGEAFYRAGNYPDAIRAFKAANRLIPSPILEYNIALAYEKLGRLRLAVKHYRSFLHAQPGAGNRATVEARIAALEQQLALRPGPAPSAGGGGERGRGSTAGSASAAASGGTAAATAAHADGGTAGSHAGSPAVAAGAVAATRAGTAGGGVSPVAPSRGAAGAPAATATRAVAGGAGSLPPPAVPAPPVEQRPPVYKRAWFWVAVAGGVAVTAVIIWAASTASARSGDNTAGYTGGLSAGFRF